MGGRNTALMHLASVCFWDNDYALLEKILDCVDATNAGKKLAQRYPGFLHYTLRFPSGVIIDSLRIL
jgi:hypothetical protein